MEIYRRKILSNRVITSIDTDGDGQDDAITLAQLTPVNIQFYLKENIDNMGLFTDFVEEVEVIDIDNIWDLGNDGAGDGGTSSDLPDLTNPYDDDTISTTGGVLPAYCTDPEAENYFNGLSQSQITALAGVFDPSTNPGGTWVVCVGCCDYGTGIDISGGVSSGNEPLLWTGTTTGMVYIIRNYQSQTKQSCRSQWGGHAFSPSDSACGGSTYIQSQCGYPQALHMARQFCNESTEDGAAAGEWSLLEFTNESNISYNGTGDVLAETTDTAPFPDQAGTIIPFGGPKNLGLEDLAFTTQTICWNDMTTTYRAYIRERLSSVAHPWPGLYTSTNTILGEKGSCNNCDNTTPYQTGRCKHDTSAKQNIVNGLSFRWLNYDISGKGCTTSSSSCIVPGNALFNNIQPSNANGSWDLSPITFLRSPTYPTATPNFCGDDPHTIYWVCDFNSDGTPDGNCTINGINPYNYNVRIPRIAANLYIHNFSFNCKKQN